MLQEKLPAKQMAPGDVCYPGSTECRAQGVPRATLKTKHRFIWEAQWILHSWTLEHLLCASLPELQIRLDTDSRVRRALLKQSIPTRGPYTQLEPMSTSSKLKDHKMTNETTDGLGLHGSFGVELRNPDDDPATDGGQPHSYWPRFLYGRRNGWILHFAKSESSVRVLRHFQKRWQPWDVGGGLQRCISLDRRTTRDMSIRHARRSRRWLPERVAFWSIRSAAC